MNVFIATLSSDGTNDSMQRNEYIVAPSWYDALERAQSMEGGYEGVRYHLAGLHRVTKKAHIVEEKKDE